MAPAANAATIPPPASIPATPPGCSSSRRGCWRRRGWAYPRWTASRSGWARGRSRGCASAWPPPVASPSRCPCRWWRSRACGRSRSGRRTGGRPGTRRSCADRRAPRGGVRWGLRGGRDAGRARRAACARAGAPRRADRTGGRGAGAGWAAATGPCAIAGMCSPPGSPFRPTPARLHHVAAASICELGAQATAGGDLSGVLPDYRRRPDAELTLERAGAGG